MRIIAGVAKGKTLLSPPDARARPTSDRAREGFFSSIISEFATLEDLKFLDLFAGSGAVGVEALSRGAAVVHAVESEGDLGDLAIQNFQLVKGAKGKYRVFHTTVQRFLESDHAVQSPYDIIFMDPPYSLSNEVIEGLLDTIIERNLLHPHGVIAIERESKSKPFSWPVAPRKLEEIKVRSYGQGSIYYGGYSASVLP